MRRLFCYDSESERTQGLADNEQVVVHDGACLKPMRARMYV